MPRLPLNSTLRLCGAVLASVIATQAHADLMRVTGVPAGDSLNVRSGPNASSADIGDLHEGDVIDIKGTSFDGKWSQISFNGQIAWVASRYLAQADGSASAPMIGPNVVSGILPDDKDGGLVVRAGPGTSEERLDVLPNGAKVHIIQLSRDQKWGMIALPDAVGWVSTRYLTSEAAATQGSQLAPEGGSLPAMFEVTGVDVGDKLWVRQSPNASAAQIGGFRNGTVIAVDAVAQGNWMQTTLNGQIGFVNARYLTRQSKLGTQTMNGFPLGVTCRGTEPFWTLTIAQDRTTQFVSLIDGADPITSLVQTTPTAGGGYPFDFLAPPYAGVLDSQSCSDGMSDTLYSMQVTFTRQDPNGSSAQYVGCCNIN